MFGRKQRDVEVRDPGSALAPFEVVTTDPRWVPVPSHFPTPQDKTVWDWTRRLAGKFFTDGSGGTQLRAVLVDVPRCPWPLRRS